MKRKTSLILLALLVITIIGSLQINNVVGQSTNAYTFEDSVLYDVNNPIPDSEFNVRNQTHFTDIYNGTYSFTDEDIGETGTDIGFITIDTSDADCQVIINEIVEGHSKVLEIDDGSNSGKVNAEASFTPAGFGTIEFWFYTEDATKTLELRFTEDGSHQGMVMNINDGDLLYYDAGWQKIEDLVDDVWSHLKIEFDSTAGGYKGLATDTYRVFLNGIEYGDYDYYQAGDVIQTFYTYTNDVDTLYSNFIDAFGLSWDEDYDINDNITPYNYPNSTLEVDKFEFYNNEDGSITLPSQEAIPYWDELIASGFIIKNAPAFPDWVWEDETAVLFQIIDADHEGLERTFDVPNSRVIQVNFTLYWYLRYENNKWYNVFEIDSFDDTLICRMRIDDDGLLGDLKLSYYNGASYVEIEDLGDEETELHLNITINDNIVRCDTDDGTYIFPTIALNKDGLGDVKLETYAGGVDPEAWLYIDSIGVYVDGVSQSNDYANYYYDIGGNYDHAEHNLFHLNATGFFSLFMRGADIGEGAHTFFEYQNVSSISFFNTYNDHQVVKIMGAWLGVTTNTDFVINSVKIQGVLLTDGITDYFPIISGSGIDNNESYFYGLGSRMHWILRVNDSDPEWIQAEFNILDLSSENRSVSFLSNINGDSLGFLRVMYSDATSTNLEFPYWLTTTTVILPQTKTIESIAILITDNDLDNDTLSTGYITSIKLIYIPDLDISIVTLNLVMVIVPLIVLIVPSVALGSRYGKSAILPTFVLMSLVCAVTELIPIWIFLVIIFGFASFLFMKRRAGEGGGK